ncbi:fatty acyl-AMP ligase [Chondromyces apiculatus]|uniref:Long-chain-fatty-acid--CoA ligase n=1 Tax=Chondromyces apiculatus DSM 436 TaxID=1192034 RepID=A0A017SW83_9BACT|nr:fatty acyl-AMP ligase [Chondromyces apiculatus]EYF01012.1 Long-chain-fatty-acid--CoA ligase [Chondromyces apiculatus DSM 436]
MSADWKPRTVAQALEDAAVSTQTGFRFLEESTEVEPFFTHAGIERSSARYGGALQALGLKKGDRVALILPDNADFVFAFLGAIRAGIVPVPIYPPTGLGKLAGYLENTLHIVEKSGAKVLVTSGEIKRMLGTIQAKAPQLEQVVAIEPLRSAREDLRPVKAELSDPCFLQFTSGSTSRPKGVILTHENLAANVRAIMQLGLAARDSVDSGVSWLPLYHDMGLIGFVIAPLYHVNTITFLPPLLFLKRPARWLETLSRYKGSISFGPNFAYALCVKRIREQEMEGLDLSHWRIAGCGAEPIRAENLRAFADKFARVGFDEKAFVCCYGMAESTLAISFSKINTGVVTDTVKGDALWAEGKAVPVRADDEGAESEGAVPIVQCGQAFEGHQIGVFAPDDEESARPLADRDVGELRLRGPSVTPGYYNEPEITKQAFAGGWLRTGDLGYLADGFVHICGRSKEVIIVNGRNYYPQDLEWEAGAVQGVRKGNVIAFGTMKPHNDRERVVIAFETTVSQPAEKQALQAEVRKAVQQALGLTVDDVVALAPGVLPKTSSGKLQRARTRELFESGELLDRTSAREVDKLDLAKELAKSQLGFLRHAIFGTKND